MAIEVVASENFHWAGREIRKGTHWKADDPVVLENRRKFRPLDAAKTYPSAWDGGPGDRERWERWGMPPRGY